MGEVRFDDDPGLTPAQRKVSVAAGDQIVRVTRRDDGSQTCSATFVTRERGGAVSPRNFELG